MIAENPLSLLKFEAAHPEIPTDEIITIYTVALAAYRSGVVSLKNAPLSTDFLLLQSEHQEREEGAV